MRPENTLRSAAFIVLIVQKADAKSVAYSILQIKILV